MHGLSRLGNGNGNARSLASPPSSPRIRHLRGKTSNQGIGERLVFLLFSVVFRRKGVLLLAPLLYIAGMLLFMGSFGFTILDLGHGVDIVYRRAPPGSVYRSPKVFKRLWPMMEADANRRSPNAVKCHIEFDCRSGFLLLLNRVLLMNAADGSMEAKS